MNRNIMAVLIGLFTVSASAFAHEEGHGPKLSDTGQYGGVMTAVVESKDAVLGAKAPLLYKAELSRTEDGTVRVYFYDTALKSFPLTGFEKSGSAELITFSGGKPTGVSFPLTLEGNSFVGQAPKAASKPYNIEITVKSNGKELLAAFDHLD